MNVKRKAALLLSGVTVAAIMVAPAAQARPTCQQTDFQSICTTNGSVSIKARPGTVAPPPMKTASGELYTWAGRRAGRQPV